MEGDSTFDLPTRQLLFPSQFPVRQSFSIPDIAGNEANVQATTWRDAIEGRITTAMQALSSIDAGILGTTITEIDTNA
jgi:hypothetical protein